MNTRLPQNHLKTIDILHETVYNSQVNKVLESQIIKIWQHQLLDRKELVTEGGEPIRIIYPGRINDNRGADFRDAVIALNGKLIKGDIEVHVKSSGWQTHQHHYDPAYNRVVLHVVMWHNTEGVTTPQNGENIPILALHKFTNRPISQWPDEVYLPASLSMPCCKATERLTPSVIAGFLDNAGEERFLAKVARFQEDLAQVEASQSLYQGIMGALGYSKNKTPFLELASRLPLQILESITQGEISDEECLARQQALLLRTAGLLPSQRPYWHPENKSNDRWVDKLERLWASSTQTEVMSWNDWHLFKVRPNNSPIRRIVAMSYLILGYRKKGILEEVVNMVKETPISQGNSRLEKGLLVTTSGYWASHLDFGLSSRVRSPTLLGSSRAADITINVLLPFTYAWSKVTSQPKLERKAIDLYRGYPKLAANTVEKHMRNQLGLSNSLVSSAQRQQGLIHIYNTLCTEGRCHLCPLGEAS